MCENNKIYAKGFSLLSYELLKQKELYYTTKRKTKLMMRLYKVEDTD